LTITNLKQSYSDSPKPKINWAKIEEAENFANTVKLFRQGKYDEDSFRRYRLQHGAYGTRMTNDYGQATQPA
jgi:sulfite reductase (ferredoxin)